MAFRFADGSALTMAFWWFGYAHAFRRADAETRKMTAELGMSPLDDEAFTYEAFAALLAGKRGGIKAFLMDQKHIAGIGNVYIQDILWSARLHPNRRISDISDSERRGLYTAIRDQLRNATELGGLKYEKDLYGASGRFDQFQVGYREGKPCPVCVTAVVKIKTGSTASFICPKCQQ
ncbi:MAG: zinc finger domain-containing protein [Chloroflexota bacterium]